MKGHPVAMTAGVALVLILPVLATIVGQTQQNAIAQPGQPGQSGAGGRTAGGAGTFGNGCGWCAAGRFYWALMHIEGGFNSHLPR